MGSYRTAFDVPLVGSTKKNYEYGDSMIGLDSANFIVPEVFGRPDAATGLCGHTSGPKFLISESFECYVMPAQSDLITLDASTYKHTLKKGTGSTETLSPTGTAAGSFSAASYDVSSNTLRNAVQNVEYKFYVNDELKLTSFEVNFNVIDAVTLTDGLFKQKFTSKFIGSSANTRSGNPGYRTGSNLFLMASNSQLTNLAGISINGDCLVAGDTATSINVPILFGSDLQIKCNIPKDKKAAYCSAPQIVNLVSSLNFIGIFGNAATGQPDVFL